MCTTKQHEEIKADPKRWITLEYIGENVFAADEFGPAERYEQRNCTCGSTLGVCFKLPQTNAE